MPRNASAGLCIIELQSWQKRIILVLFCPNFCVASFSTYFLSSSCLFPGKPGEKR